MTADAVVFGGHDKIVHARNPKNGEVLWDFATKGAVDGSPVIVGNRVFVGSADGRIYGLDLKTGNEVWKYEAGGGFIGSPAVASGRLLIASNDGVVYCFGEKRWTMMNERIFSRGACTALGSALSTRPEMTKPHTSDSITRRDFVKTIGAGAAVAGLPLDPARRRQSRQRETDFGLGQSHV